MGFKNKFRELIEEILSVMISKLPFVSSRKHRESVEALLAGQVMEALFAGRLSTGDLRMHLESLGATTAQIVMCEIKWNEAVEELRHKHPHVVEYGMDMVSNFRLINFPEMKDWEIALAYALSLRKIASLRHTDEAQNAIHEIVFRQGVLNELLATFNVFWPVSVKSGERQTPVALFLKWLSDTEFGKRMICEKTDANADVPQSKASMQKILDKYNDKDGAREPNQIAKLCRGSDKGASLEKLFGVIANLALEKNLTDGWTEIQNTWHFFVFRFLHSAFMSAVSATRKPESGVKRVDLVFERLGVWAAEP